MRTLATLLSSKLTIHAQNLKTIWEIVSFQPQIKVDLYFFSVLFTTAMNVIYCQEL